MKIADSVFMAQGAIVAGEVTIGEDCGIWYNAVIRGDLEPISIGDRSNVQDCAVLHVDMDCPVVIGDDVTIGHGAIVHGCTIGDNSLIGMGATILNGAVIGDDCIIGAGALVTANKEIPNGHMAFGNPAKVIRELTPEEIEGNRMNAKFYVDLAREQMEKDGK